ncbi:MAG: Fpg/Nei family DNA glycosylase [Bradymonadia bacterium]
MPEGDTLHRTARTLHEVFAGRPIVEAEVGTRRGALRSEDLVGRVLLGVEARGKNLLVHFDDDHVLWSHLGMTGSWHVRCDGDPWPRPRAQLDLGLRAPHASALGFNVPVLERMRAAQALRHPALASLGPDLLATPFDLESALARWRGAPYATLGDALLDQRLACGIGNVYKAEALFVTGLDPWRRVVECDDETLTQLLERARALMLRNLDGRPRRTHAGPGEERYFVYGREGLPCRRCEAPVRKARQGEHARVTYYCAPCQGVVTGGA